MGPGLLAILHDSIKASLLRQQRGKTEGKSPKMSIREYSSEEHQLLLKGMHNLDEAIDCFRSKEKAYCNIDFAIPLVLERFPERIARVFAK